MKKKSISRLLNESYRRVGLKDTVIFADQLMYMGFSFAARSGSSVGVNDFVIPDAKVAIIDRAEGEVKEIEQQFRDQQWYQRYVYALPHHREYHE